jgi:DNA invertase Pin-like site-specific DNA recombinase
MGGKPVRAVIYARYSTDLQTERSTEDQIALCRDYAKREGFNVIRTFEDRARSGASVLGRDGLLSLLALAADGGFDVLLVEHADRISRSIRDLADIHEKLAFRGIQIRAVHSDVMDTATIGLFGLVGQMQREEGAKKVRRGMAGGIRDNRHAGGPAYGYRPVAGKPGELEIEPQEAETVREIFNRYAKGLVPRQIAADLNARRVPPPRGRVWGASTLNGNMKRGSGILLNRSMSAKSSGTRRGS